MPVLTYAVSKQAWFPEGAEGNGMATPRAERKPGDAGAWEGSVHKLDTFRQLENDWDGLGAKAPSRDLLASAIGLAHVLNEQGVQPPQAVVVGLDGSVIFEWQDADGTFAEVEIVRPYYAEVMLLEPGRPAKHWTLPTE